MYIPPKSSGFKVSAHLTNNKNCFLYTNRIRNFPFSFMLPVYVCGIFTKHYHQCADENSISNNKQ